jgi:hypothetical protein
MSPDEANTLLVGLADNVRAKLLAPGDRAEFLRTATKTVLGALIFEGEEYNRAHPDRVSVEDMLQVLAAVADLLKSR